MVQHLRSLHFTSGHTTSTCRGQNLRRSEMPLPERVVEDGFQLYQALFGPARQMQSYYGSSPAAKRFEVTRCERELQLPEGVVHAWNGEVLRWGRGQQQEESFRGAALVDLPDGMKISKDQESPAPAAQVWIRAPHESGGTLFWGPPQSAERAATRYSLADAASQKRYAVPRSYSVPRSAGVFRRGHTARSLLLARAWRVQEIDAWSQPAPISARSLTCFPGCLDRVRDRPRAAHKP